jgi:hypothetical protein
VSHPDFQSLFRHAENALSLTDGQAVFQEGEPGS